MSLRSHFICFVFVCMRCNTRFLWFVLKLKARCFIIWFDYALFNRRNHTESYLLLWFTFHTLFVCLLIELSPFCFWIVQTLTKFWVHAASELENLHCIFILTFLFILNLFLGLKIRQRVNRELVSTCILAQFWLFKFLSIKFLMP